MKVNAYPSENIETEVKHLNSNEKLAKYLTDIVNEVYYGCKFLLCDEKEYNINLSEETNNKEIINENFEISKINRFYNEGTTSYIFEVSFKNREGFGALKILKYRYKDVSAITNDTKKYQLTYGEYRYIPKIYLNGSSYILMEFIEGQTLQEYIIYELHHNPNKNKIISEIFLELCNILKYFASEGILHSDLNTSNIILKDSTRIKKVNDQIVGLEIYLIDFGVNFTLSERISTSQALFRTSIYIPKEVLRAIILVQLCQMFILLALYF